MRATKFYSLFGSGWLLIWFYRLITKQDINLRILNTATHKTWIQLHIFMYFLAGYKVQLKDQKKVFLIYFLFEMIEYSGKKIGIPYLNNTLDLPNHQIVIHDIIMNASCQLVGLALSERLQILIK